MLLTNYHTHHNRCKHAKGNVEDYVKEAVKHQYAEIGMSCHTPHQNFPQMGVRRMDYSDLATYFNDIEQAQKKYPQIKVLKALECEYFPHLYDYMVELRKQTDYLILAQHYIEIDGKFQDAFHFTKPKQLEVYAACIEEAMATKLFAILAHPDVFMTLYPRFDEACEAAARRIGKAALENDVILEVNANGLRRQKQTYEDGVRYPYPSEKFWSIIATEFPSVKVVVNSDCHDPAYLNDEYMQMARDMAKRLNLNVIERL
ncbi:histidinol-phosphatase [Turicibacter sp. TJ11]|uniref:histidinol-phosphatase n=1 Tax=Turicibacter sp. TJ11 TaxID=2806443 RepID=UPI001F46794B|nr:histidinol-phosphatase [Turicibacter sp. TJ11]